MPDPSEVRTMSSTGGQIRWRAGRPVRNPSLIDTAYVAGLVEGEGSFYLKSGTYPAAIFQLNMADEDVVRRARRMTLGIGSVNPLAAGPRSVKQQWRWRISAQAEVAWFMDLMHPWMGARRKAKIDELRAHLPAWTKEAA